jgi:hypothetical protein
MLGDAEARPARTRAAMEMQCMVRHRTRARDEVHCGSPDALRMRPWPANPRCVEGSAPRPSGRRAPAADCLRRDQVVMGGLTGRNGIVPLGRLSPTGARILATRMCTLLPKIGSMLTARQFDAQHALSQHVPSR